MKTMLDLRQPTSKTIRDIQNTLLSPATEENSNNTLLISNFTHPVEVINNTQ